MRAIAGLLLLCAVAVAGCGGGDPVDRTRDVGAFDRIDVSAGVKVVVRHGAGPTVTVHAGEKVVDRVVTETAGGALRISERDRGIVIGPDPFDGVRVTVTAPALRGVAVHGSADVDLTDLTTDRFDVAITGGGDVTARGSAEHLDASVDGAGELSLSELRARTGRVEIHGAGDVDVAVAEQLAIEVHGAGDVTYHGDPQVQQDIHGAGDVRRAP